MHRAAVAAITGVTLVLTACGSTNQPGVGDTGEVGRVEAITSSATQSACVDTPTQGVSSVMVDWVDFVHVGGVQYVAGPPGQAQAVPSDELGVVVGRVTCMLSALKFTKQPGPAVDGDAGFLEVGTEVYSIREYAPACRVAAKRQGVNRVYVAVSVAGGSTAQAACAK